MQIIHNDFKIDLRSHPSTLSLGEGGSKTKQKGKKNNLSGDTPPLEYLLRFLRVGQEFERLEKAIQKTENIY